MSVVAMNSSASLLSPQVRPDARVIFCDQSKELIEHAAM
jgi:hypothetical protein